MPPVVVLCRRLGETCTTSLSSSSELAGQPVPQMSDQAQAEQPAQDLPSTWNDIAVGHLVIAHESATPGWWEAIVLARDGDMLTLKWRDYPWQTNVVRHATTVALLKPDPVAT